MTRRSRLSAALATLMAIVLGTFTALAAPAAPAAAADLSKFDPGMIITDELFYDGNAMTVSQIQSFLNARVPTCLDDNLENDITCLKDYRTTTTAKSAAISSAGAVMCSEIGVRSGSAAEIIDLVARACGVSQKVLLVLLQKEQGLVTATDPGWTRYRSATGYGCPDTAPCDEQYYGFFNQLYNAALQFKRYQAYPLRYAHVAGLSNQTVRYHPNSSCGSSNVVIENQATAGLYNYTPYQPNRAALNAGYGTGDSCSSYGNRNFFSYYTDWFGPPAGYPVDRWLGWVYNAEGGQSVLGVPYEEAVYVSANGGGLYQRTTKGWIYKTDTGIGTSLLWASDITKAYSAAGGPAGSWGWPIASLSTDEGYPLVEFQHVRVAEVDGEVIVGYPFTDISDNPNSSDYTALAEGVLWMAGSGISEGWTTSSGVEYRPLQTVNRDVMAAFLYRFAGANYTPSGDSSFVDVPSSNPFTREIEWLGTTGISNGWSTSRGAEFRPLTPITREQMAAFLYRLEAPSGYTPPSRSPFIDVRTSDTFYTEIAWMAQSGVSTGWSTSRGAEYRPLTKITREQMAAFLQRLDQLDD